MTPTPFNEHVTNRDDQVIDLSSPLRLEFQRHHPSPRPEPLPPSFLCLLRRLQMTDSPCRLLLRGHYSSMWMVQAPFFSMWQIFLLLFVPLCLCRDQCR